MNNQFKYFVILFALFTILGSNIYPFGNEKFNIYGYFSVNVEKVGKSPSGVDGSGETTYERNPVEFSYPHFDLMISANPVARLKLFTDVGYFDGDQVELVSAFGEWTFRDYLKLSAGKILRPFGLFNENLQAVPTYLGIEPPELFDKDHLMLQRTTIGMIHGNVLAGKSSIRYSLSTDQGESVNDTIPVGWDVRWEYEDILVVGHSGYFSPEKESTVAIGDGSPRGGIKPWMSSDKFSVLGVFAQLELGGFTLKTAYWHAIHKAERDPNSIIAIYNNTGLNTRQMERFGLDDYAVSSDINDIQTKANYSVQTFYIRLGYNIMTKKVGVFTPYLFWDFYKNPESIEDKTYGGDGEAGQTDDGVFNKPTWGIVYRPVINWAIKLDGSSHLFKFNGKNESYSEVRFDISYFFN